MITERIGEHEVLLPINQNYDKNFRYKIDIGNSLPPPPKKKKKKKTVNMAKCKTTVQLQAVYTVPLVLK